MSTLRKSKFWLFLIAGIFTTLTVILFISVNYNTIDSSHFGPSLKNSSLSARHTNYGLDHYLYPKPWILINIPMKYLLNNDICQKEEILLIILITSHAGDIEFRQKIRETLPFVELRKLKIRRAFILGKTDLSSTNGKYKKVTLEDIHRENENYSDLIVGDFLESYKNLTYKHLLGLTWATNYCTQAKYIVKQDDDVIVDWYQLVNMLRKVDSFTPSLENNGQSTEHEFVQKIKNKATDSDRRFIMGKTLIKYPVIRNPTSKWFVTKSDFDKEFYPDFVSGWAYITTIETAADMVKWSKEMEYFWIDDVHVTGTLRKKASIELLDLSKLFTQYKGQLLCCLAPSTIKSKTNEPYWCDFLIGPSNDDLKLFSDLQQHSGFCFTSKSCVRRSAKEELNNTCVLTDTVLQQTQLPSGKGKAIWHPIKL